MDSSTTRNGEATLRALWRISDEAPAHWLVLHSATLVEAHANKALTRAVALTDIAQTRMGAALLAQAGDLDRNWGSRREWLQVASGFQFMGELWAGHFQTVVDLRNAIAHGHGSLTDMQQENFSSFVDLRRRLSAHLDVNTQGAALQFGACTRKKVRAACIKFVHELDRGLLNRDPRFGDL